MVSAWRRRPAAAGFHAAISHSRRPGDCVEPVSSSLTRLKPGDLSVSRCLRQKVRWEEYSPSRRINAAIPPGPHLSASFRMCRLYLAENASVLPCCRPQGRFVREPWSPAQPQGWLPLRYAKARYARLHSALGQPSLSLSSVLLFPSGFSPYPLH